MSQIWLFSPTDECVTVAKKSTSTVDILGVDETFDWPADDDCCQFLFIQSIWRSEAIADIFFTNQYFWDFLRDNPYLQDASGEAMCTVRRRDIFDIINRTFLVSFRSDMSTGWTWGFNRSTTQWDLVKEAIPIALDLTAILCSGRPRSVRNFLRKKGSTNRPIEQRILEHSMMRQQFNHPVYCAICNEFIWYFIVLRWNTFEFSIVLCQGSLSPRLSMLRMFPGHPSEMSSTHSISMSEVSCSKCHWQPFVFRFLSSRRLILHRPWTCHMNSIWSARRSLACLCTVNIITVFIVVHKWHDVLYDAEVGYNRIPEAMLSSDQNACMQHDTRTRTIEFEH